MKRLSFILFVFLFVFATANGQEKKYIKYEVQEGETVQSISRKLSITPYDLMKLNPDLKNGIEGIKLLIIPNKNYKPNTAETHRDYVEDGFLYHKVLPQENFFRLKQKYGAAKRVLRRYNPVLRRDDLKAGQILKIPVPRSFKLPENSSDGLLDTDTKPYLVRAKETKFSIARRYGITIEKLELLNPMITESSGGLKIGMIIKVPNTLEIPNENDDYVTHRVEKGDTFFNLGQRFAVSEEELLANNPELNEGLKEGMLIKIPTVLGTEKLFTPFISPGKEVKALLLLPFMSQKVSVNFDKNRTSDIVSDFYLGAAIALDSLKKQGLSVHVKVFDTENNEVQIRSIFSAVDLNGVDFILGPMFYSNLDYVTSELKNKNIPLISPMSKNNHGVFGFNKMIQETAPKEELADRMLAHITKNYTDQNLVIVSDTSRAIQPILANALDVLKKMDSTRTPMVIKPEEGYIKRELFIENLPEDRDNWVLLISDDPVVTRDVVNNLGSMPEAVKLTFFALNKGRNFDEQKDMNESLAQINFHFPANNYIDYESEAVQNFIAKYKRQNFVKPSEYAFRGFDLMYDALLRFASYDNLDTAMQAGISKRLSTRFEYDQNGFSGGFVNKGSYLLKYDGLNIIEVTD